MSNVLELLISGQLGAARELLNKGSIPLDITIQIDNDQATVVLHSERALKQLSADVDLKGGNAFICEAVSAKNVLTWAISHNFSVASNGVAVNGN